MHFPLVMLLSHINIPCPVLRTGTRTGTTAAHRQAQLYADCPQECRRCLIKETERADEGLCLHKEGALLLGP